MGYSQKVTIVKAPKILAYLEDPPTAILLALIPNSAGPLLYTHCSASTASSTGAGYLFSGASRYATETTTQAASASRNQVAFRRIPLIHTYAHMCRKWVLCVDVTIAPPSYYRPWSISIRQLAKHIGPTSVKEDKDWPTALRRGSRWRKDPNVTFT